MTKLEFNYENRIKRLELSNVNVFAGGNNTGKTTLLNILASVFQGQDASASYNLQPIAKSQYNVKILNSLQTIEDELKLTSKSELLAITKQAIQSLEEDTITKIQEDLKKAIKPLENQIKDRVHLSDNDGFIFDDLMDLIKNYFSFIDSKELSISSKRYALFYSLIAKLERKETILFIDDFEAFFDLEQMLKIVQALSCNPNFIIFIFTKSSDFCKCIFQKYPIFLLTKELQEFRGYVYHYFDKQVLSSSRQLSFSLVTEEEIKQNFTNVLRVYFNEIFQLTICKESDYLLQNFKKMKFLSKEDFKILENFKKEL